MVADMESGERSRRVDFWFDPLCPWAWLTSRWLQEAAAVRGLAPHWHLMSLEFLNEDKEVPADYRATLEDAIKPVRVCAAAADAHGADVLGPLYTEIGRRFHDQGRGRDRDAWPQTLGEALEAAGISRGLVAAMDSAEFDARIRRSHAAGIGLVGEEVGTPVIATDGVAFFGPVVSPAPRGEDAGRLWDGVLAVARTDGFFELKRTRTRGPVFG